MQKQGAKLGGVSVGHWAQISRTFGPRDVEAFAAVSGDANPLHLDPDFAATTPFGRPIVHGMLGAAMFSAVFATRIPGAIYLSQNLSFTAPVFVGDVVRAKIEVLELRRRTAICSTTVEAADPVALQAQTDGASSSEEEEELWRLAIQGEAKVVLPRDS